jgi:preprotein translocase subunit SecA
MIDKIIKAIFGDSDKKKIKNYQKIVELIKKKEEEFSSFTIKDVQEKTKGLKKIFE